MSEKASNPKDSVGVRKAPMHVVPQEVLAEIGLGMLEGARKYGAHNYRVAGIRASVYYDAAMRHLMAWWEGENLDPDSGLSHVVKALCTLVVLRDAMHAGTWTDDRPPRLDPAWMAGFNDLAAQIIDRRPDAVEPFTQARVEASRDAGQGDLFPEELVQTTFPLTGTASACAYCGSMVCPGCRDTFMQAAMDFLSSSFGDDLGHGETVRIQGGEVPAAVVGLPQGEQALDALAAHDQALGLYGDDPERQRRYGWANLMPTDDDHILPGDIFEIEDKATLERVLGGEDRFEQANPRAVERRLRLVPAEGAEGEDEFEQQFDAKLAMSKLLDELKPVRSTRHYWKGEAA